MDALTTTTLLSEASFFYSPPIHQLFSNDHPLKMVIVDDINQITNLNEPA
jgi:hypothetical protein